MVSLGSIFILMVWLPIIPLPETARHKQAVGNPRLMPELLTSVPHHVSSALFFVL